jgi:hypothetical protein
MVYAFPFVRTQSTANIEKQYMQPASERVVRVPVTVLRGRSKSVETDQTQLADLQKIADWMDTAFEIPGLGIRFGLDALLGLVPGLGDALTSLVSLYIIGMASRHGLPRVTLMRMGMNVALDSLLGAIPFVGDLFDVYWKSNQLNVAILRRHLEALPHERRKARSADWLVLMGLALLLVLAVTGAVAILVFAVQGIGRLIH